MKKKDLKKCLFALTKTVLGIFIYHILVESKSLKTIGFLNFNFFCDKWKDLNILVL